jgi:flavorubredoxin
MPKYNYDDAIPVSDNIYWVGFCNESARMHCNPYLLIDGDEAVLLDPGSVPDFPIIMRKIIDLINPDRISLIIAAHQDPDVCANLPIVEDLIGRQDLKIAGHTNTLRLIEHLGLKSALYAVDKHAYRYTLNSGRVLTFHPTLYLHCPGSIVTYDTQSKSLFSSDLFGAVDDQWSLFNSSNFPYYMDSFHQAYMPSNAILRPCLEKLETLDIARILPQHGSVIEQDRVAEAFAHVKNLRCGVDLFEDE